MQTFGIDELPQTGEYGEIDSNGGTPASRFVRSQAAPNANRPQSPPRCRRARWRACSRTAPTVQLCRSSPPTAARRRKPTRAHSRRSKDGRNSRSSSAAWALTPPPPRKRLTNCRLRSRSRSCPARRTPPQSWIDRARARPRKSCSTAHGAVRSGRRRHRPANAAGICECNKGVSRLEQLLSRGTGYFGVTNLPRRAFRHISAQASADRVVALRRRGLFISSGIWPAHRRSALSAARASVPNTAADRIIDARRQADAIDDQLLNLEALALQNQSAIGAGFAHPVTMEQVGRWARCGILADINWRQPRPCSMHAPRADEHERRIPSSIAQRRPRFVPQTTGWFFSASVSPPKAPISGRCRKAASTAAKNSKTPYRERRRDWRKVSARRTARRRNGRLAALRFPHRRAHKNEAARTLFWGSVKNGSRFGSKGT